VKAVSYNPDWGCYSIVLTNFESGYAGVSMALGDASYRGLIGSILSYLDDPRCHEPAFDVPCESVAIVGTPGVGCTLIFATSEDDGFNLEFTEDELKEAVERLISGLVLCNDH